MKKSNLFLVLMMALIVMSCSKDETTMSIPQESNAIEFGTYVGRSAQTRAADIDLEGMKTGTNAKSQNVKKGFGVFAYYTDNGDYNNSTTPYSKPNFMYNQFVEWDATLNSGSGAWKYSPVKYWPNETGTNETYNEDKLSFFAYAPYSEAEATGNFAFTPAKEGTGDPTITYTVNANAKLQEDLLWGVKTDGFPFLNQQKQRVGENIKFTFKHALARIGFNVEAMIDEINSEITGDQNDQSSTGNGGFDATTKIAVREIKLIGKFYPSGALNLNNTAANVPLWTTTAPGADREFVLNASTAAADNNFELVDATTLGQLVLTTTEKQKLNNDDSYLMVIPQKFKSGGTETDETNGQIKIRVTYDVITADAKLETGQSKVTNVITSTPFDFPFVGGNAYTFNLHLGMTSVKFSAEVSPWTEVTPGTVVNVPINN